MTAVYPATLASINATKQDDTDTKSGSDLGISSTTGDHAAHHNQLAEELVATQTELGTDPSGSFTDVATRLNARLTCRKTADQTISNATLVNLTDMSFPISTTGIDYYFNFIITMSAAALATGWKVTLTCPALTGYITASVWGPISSTAEATSAAPVLANMHQWGLITASGDTVQGYQTPANATIYPIKIEGILSNPSATGTLQVQAASEAAAASIWRRGAYGEMFIG